MLDGGRRRARGPKHGCTSTEPSDCGPSALPFRHLTAGTSARTRGPGRPQVAECPLRLGDRVLRASRRAPGRDGRQRQLPRADRSGAQRQLDCTLEFSRRARGFPTRLPPRSRQRGHRGAGRALLRPCDRFAERLGAEPGVEILNEVVLNQVLVRFGDDDALTQATVKRRAGGRHVLARRHGVARQARCASRSPTGGRPRTTSSAPPARSWRGRPRGSPARCGRREPSGTTSSRRAADYAAQFHESLDDAAGRRRGVVRRRSRGARRAAARRGRARTPTVALAS